MLKETLCVLFLVGVSTALHPSFKIVDAGSRERITPHRHHVRHNYGNDDDDDDDDDDVDSAPNSADQRPPYRHSGSAATGFDRGLDPLAVRAARLSAYRAALLRSLQADQVFDNQHAERFGGRGAGGNRSARGRTGGRAPPQRDGYEGGNAYRTQDERHFRRPSTHTQGRGYRGQRTTAESRDIDDEGYY